MLFLCALTISVKAQSPTQNYVLTKDVLDVDGTHAITTVTYYDGLGYPVETATNDLGGTVYNLTNTIGHEELHKESDVPLTYLVHSQIVLKQLADANFSNGSEKYQTGTIGNMIVLMNEANKNEQSANALIQIMVKANSIIKPLGLGRIVRRNIHFEDVYGTK